jgi:hypothetical protein
MTSNQIAASLDTSSPQARARRRERLRECLDLIVVRRSGERNHYLKEIAEPSRVGRQDDPSALDQRADSVRATDLVALRLHREDRQSGFAFERLNQRSLLT